MPRAPYASNPDQSRGRLVEQAVSATRSAFQRDRDRIIHATAFRRLKHKTQVFVSAYDDHYRTRLTHSLEVAQIARTLARQLGLDEDLTEALALAHDLGHTAFGHAGETALARCMATFGGFDHNAQTIRIVTRLEQRYAAFDGINLTWETLEGLAKHNGPVAHPPWALAEYNALHDLDLHSYASAEAQIAAISDDIAYNAHDLDDGLRAGLFSLDEARAVPLVDHLWREAAQAFPAASDARRIPELVRMLIGMLTDDVLVHTQAQLTALAPPDVAAVRAAARPVATFSGAMRNEEQALKRFLRRTMYDHPSVAAATRAAQTIVDSLFMIYMAEPHRLPPAWLDRARQAGRDDAGQDEAGQARIVADFIAGMTDRFAIRSHAALTGDTQIAAAFRGPSATQD